MKAFVKNAADRVAVLWRAVQIPCLIYIGLRLYYVLLAALLTYVYQPPFRDGIVQHADSFSKYFLMTWQHWDTVWYLRIALEGYGIFDGRSVFPPLYPYLIRGLNPLFGNYMLTALGISFAAGGGAAGMLYLLSKKWLDEKAGEWAVIALLLFPTTVFFLGAYTEALFLALSLGTFSAAEKGRFGWAGMFAALATLTRLQGVILALPLCWLIWNSIRAGKTSRLHLLHALTPVAALILFWQARTLWLDPTPINTVYEQYWNSHFVLPGESLLASFAMLPYSFNVQYFINVLDLGLLLLAILITPAVLRSLPLQYGLYQTATLLALLLRVGPPDNPLQGMGRYMLLLFPAFMVIGNWIKLGKRKYILVPSLLLATWILVTFILGIGIVS